MTCCANTSGSIEAGRNGPEQCRERDQHPPAPNARRPRPRPSRRARTRLRVELLGITLEHVQADELDDVVEQRLSAPFDLPLALGSVNLDHIHHFGRGSAQVGRRSAPAAVDWLMLIDGAPVARRAHDLTEVEWPRLAGADLLPGLLSVAERIGARVGFLGGHQDGVAALHARLAENWPGLDVAGVWTPPRTTVTSHRASQELAQAIRDSGVDLLVVGLGKPRQEEWIDAHGERTGASVLLAFGAAADFLAGSARRAPQWMRNAGLEWLFRLGQEPRRLARRYLVEGPVALWSLRRAEAVVSYDEVPLFAVPAPVRGAAPFTAPAASTRVLAP